jgi:MFS family permease
MKNTEIGALLGPIYGFSGAIGSFAGGALTDHFGKRDSRLYLRIPAYAIILSIFFATGYLFLKNSMLSLVCLGCCSALQSTYLGPAISVAHRLVPASMRALTSAILFFVLNLVGLGFGPLTVGIISDWLHPTLGVESLRWALSIVPVVSVGSVLLFFGAAKRFAAEII